MLTRLLRVARAPFGAHGSASAVTDRSVPRKPCVFAAARPIVVLGPDGGYGRRPW
jgi:hypothetical protein